jgi:hypothetical protein
VEGLGCGWTAYAKRVSHRVGNNWNIAVSPTSRVKERRIASRKAARSLLKKLLAGDGNVYEAYQGLHIRWCAKNAAVSELRPLSRITGIEPDGILSVNDEFREQALKISKMILSQFPD